MAGRDQRTRYQGVFARHSEACALDRGGQCDCAPAYYGKVYDRATRRYVNTKRFPTVTAAKGARQKLIELMEAGELPQVAPTRLRDAHTRFVEAAREGRALNKHGRRYKPSAIKDIDECLRVHVIPRLGPRRLTDVRRSDVQKLVDDLTPTMSGSRVRSVVNAIRSLYRWAQDREMVGHDPAALVRLPAMNATPRDRVATPAEFAASSLPSHWTTLCRTRLRVTRWGGAGRSSGCGGGTSTWTSARSSGASRRMRASRVPPGA